MPRQHQARHIRYAENLSRDTGIPETSTLWPGTTGGQQGFRYFRYTAPLKDYFRAFYY